MLKFKLGCYSRPTCAAHTAAHTDAHTRTLQSAQVVRPAMPSPLLFLPFPFSFCTEKHSVQRFIGGLRVGTWQAAVPACDLRSPV